VVSEVQIEFTKETKCLGVVLDSKLLLNSHIKREKEKAIRALMACRWIYTMVVRPMMSYAAFVW
jgi:hypothetical protein